MRAPLRKPLTRSQATACLLLANGHNYSDIAERLGTGPDAAKFHVHAAAKKIPGDLPAQMKVVCWLRGATKEVLEGKHTNDCLDELVKSRPLARS